MPFAKPARVLFSFALALALAACGGGSDDPPAPPPVTYTIGGTASGLTGTVILQNNAGNNLSVAANGSFTFTTAINSGSAYAVTVLTPPVGQSCTVTSGSGTASANVTNVAVSCAATPARTITVSVSGLTGTGLVLQNNGGDSLTITANGSATFAMAITSGTNYSVTVSAQPLGQNCVVVGATGTATANVLSVAVTCSTAVTRTIGGSASGLTGTVVLQNNGGSNLSVTANGGFTFGTAVNTGGTYLVTVLTQPAGQTCTVARGSGVANANVTNVGITCTTNSGTAIHTVSGGITGMTSSGLVLSLSRNGTVVESLPPLAANVTTFVFTTKLSTGDAWVVAVATQPNSPVAQGCTLISASGTIATASVSSTQATCTTITVAIKGTVTMESGTLAAGLVLQNNLGDDLAVTAGAATTSFQFATTQTLPSAYSVSIKTQPAGQTCIISKGWGFAGANISAGGLDIPVLCYSAFTHTALSGTYRVTITGGQIGRNYMTFFSDGTYIFAIRSDDTACGNASSARGDGIEYGAYDYNPATQTILFGSAVVDTSGGCGLHDSDDPDSTRTLRNVTRNGTTKVISGALTDDTPALNLVLTPVSSATGQLLGAWAAPTRQLFTVYDSDNTFFLANTQVFQGVGTTALLAGFEDACYVGAAATASSGSYTMNFATCSTLGKPALDTNGNAGWSGFGANRLDFTVTGDVMTTAIGTGTPITSNRIPVSP
jgi:hypothetical protein